MIGLIDSGIGGISVLRALETLSPGTPFLYYADTAQFPYGNKSSTQIERSTSQACAFLLSKGVNAILIACHTASAHALKALQARFPIPIFGMTEPTLDLPPNKKVALMATQATIRSGLYQAKRPDIIPLPCPGLAEMIEASLPETEKYLQETLTPITGQKVDILVLGCTHYTLIQREIEEELDLETTVHNPTFAAASQTAPFIEQSEPAPHTLYVTGPSATLESYLEKHPLQQNTSIKKPF